MLNRSNLKSYQKSAIEFIKSINKGALFLDMGLGKTVSTLTVISDFLDDLFCLNILVIAPLRVANDVWAEEYKQWEHLKHLDIGICTGKASNRNRILHENHRITVINRENVVWLCDNYDWKWDMLVIDESSSFKNYSSKRFEILKDIVADLKSVILLTGTPTPNGMMDLWSQIYLIDQGKRLGKYITHFRNKYFIKDLYCEHVYHIKNNADKDIMSAIKDISVSMKSEDYIELPDRIDLYTLIEMPSATRKQYKELEKEFVLSLSTGDEVLAKSKAVLVNKLLQLCNGAIYYDNDDKQKYHELHKLKLEALKDIIEDNPSENFLVIYNFKSDLIRLKDYFTEIKTISKTGEEIEQWNKGKIKLLAIHPASAGHGLNLQFGGSIIVWFGLNWNLEYYQQTNKRLHRLGQTKPVRIMHLVIKNSIDEKILSALFNKKQTQEELIEYLKYEYKVNEE